VSLKAVPKDWHTVREALEHPDHPGLVGDLCKHEARGVYQLLVFDEQLDNYVNYSVPHAWGAAQERA
jgi:hypothetical protein